MPSEPTSATAARYRPEASFEQGSNVLSLALLFRGRSAQNFRDPGFLGIMNPENDARYLPLKKGATICFWRSANWAPDGVSFAVWQTWRARRARPGYP